jgi:hypothetical protein
MVLLLKKSLRIKISLYYDLTYASLRLVQVQYNNYEKIPQWARQPVILNNSGTPHSATAVNPNYHFHFFTAGQARLRVRLV